MSVKITWTMKLALMSLVVCFLLCGTTAKATVIGPYTADANTLHLWHIDESANNIEDYGYTDANDIDVQANGGTIALGATAYAGFGTAVSVPGTADRVEAVSQPVTQSQLQGANGAFTYEALVKVGSISADESQAIMSLSNGGEYSGQAFQFRISGGNLQFIQVAPSVTVVQAAIPLSGDNAWSADNWYHVAVTYSGEEGAENNTLLYWTKLVDSATEASLLVSGTLGSDITSSATHYFTIGNRYSGVSMNGEDSLRGLIDEVRISSVVRGPDQFVFAVPEPGTWVLLFAGLMGFLTFRILRKRRGTE